MHNITEVYNQISDIVEMYLNLKEKIEKNIEVETDRDIISFIKIATLEKLSYMGQEPK